MYYFCNALLPTLQNTHAHTRRSVDILPEMNRNRLPVTDTYELLTNELQFIFCMSLFRTLRTHRPRFSVLHVQVARLTHTQPLSHMIKHDFEGIVHPRTDLFLITNMFNAHIDCISCLFLDGLLSQTKNHGLFPDILSLSSLSPSGVEASG